MKTVSYGIAGLTSLLTLVTTIMTNTFVLGKTSETQSRQFVVTKRYLNFPITQDAPKRAVQVSVGGKVVARFDAEFATDTPGWWSPLDVSAWHGQSMTVSIENMPDTSQGIDSVSESDTPKGEEDVYKEALRPQFHFSAQRGWLNDPNGMVYFNGRYHLFFQHSAFSWNDATKSWGNAVSKDMVHWQELPEALLPDLDGAIWSGSGVDDVHNTSGFGSNGNPPIVLMYTAAGDPFVQCIASSTDGIKFHKYDKNPVVQNIAPGDRDPRVFWYEPTKHWVMALWVGQDGQNTIQFFVSPNLRDWTHSSTFKGGSNGDNFLYECPDIFELPVDGHRDNMKWVLTAANGEYAVGTFDGRAFHADETHLHGQLGTGYYAPQTFNHEPKGRRVQIGWMQTETHGMPFNQSMSLPIELKLVSTPGGPRMTWTPVQELESIRGIHHQFGSMILSQSSANPLSSIEGDLLEIRTSFEPQPGTITSYNIRGVNVSFDANKQQLTVNGNVALAPLRRGKQTLAIYVDRTSVEVFASDGLVYMPVPINTDSSNRNLSVTVQGGSVEINAIDVYILKSIW